ncbi:hypothetical protein niasHS_010940 [Heterodera schachtii]|uniref:Carrier domain-containing protein n=1 Tax=Heterodera schachtii TaxID=97005 RepID=A0ABD2J3I8_HETSC
MLRSTALPIAGLGDEAFSTGGDSLYILELFELTFKQFPNGAFVLRLSFFNFFSRRFCGSLHQIPCHCSSSSITLNITLHFRAFSSHKNVFIVLELANNDGAALCWTTVPVFEVSRIASDSVPSVGGNQLRQSFPLFAGSCRVLLFSDSLPPLVPHFLPFNAILSASLRLSSELPSVPLPEFLLLSGSPKLSSDEADPSAFTFTSILDNLLLSYAVHSDLSDSLILDLISRELCYGRNQPHSEASHQLRVMERRLKIGTHNGLGFVEEPLSVLLHSNSSSSAAVAVGDSFRQRSQSLGRRDGSNFGSSEFCARNSVRLGPLSAADPSTAIVFVLEYLVASRTAANVRVAHDVFFFNQYLLFGISFPMFGWSASVGPRGLRRPGGRSVSRTQSPFRWAVVRRGFNPSVQLLGGPRPAPFDGFCLRDLSHCAFVRHSPIVQRQFPSPFPLSCTKIQIRFNFVPLMESDRIGALSLLSSHQQTPLPRPDLRPRSSAATRQVEHVLPPLPPAAQTKGTSESQKLAFEEDDREEAELEELLSPVEE